MGKIMEVLVSLMGMSKAAVDSLKLVSSPEK